MDRNNRVPLHHTFRITQMRGFASWFGCLVPRGENFRGGKRGEGRRMDRKRRGGNV